MKLESESEYIFSQTNNQTQSVKNSNEYYTIIGYQDFLDSDNRPRLNSETNKTFAKIQNNKYYIKVGTYNRIYNPIGLFSEGKANNFISKSGKQEFPFKQVSKDTFDLYVNFLATKNIAWLNNAERGMV